MFVARSEEKRREQDRGKEEMWERDGGKAENYVHTFVLLLDVRERRSEAWSTPPSSLLVTTRGLASLFGWTPVGHLTERERWMKMSWFLNDAHLDFIWVVTSSGVSCSRDNSQGCRAMSRSVQRNEGCSTKIRSNRFFRFGVIRELIDGHSDQNCWFGKAAPTNCKKWTECKIVSERLKRQM